MALLDRIQADLVAAMKAKDEQRLSAVRMIKSALKKQEIDSMKPLDETSELQVLNTLIKQRRDSIDMFRKGGREDHRGAANDLTRRLQPSAYDCLSTSSRPRNGG